MKMRISHILVGNTTRTISRADWYKNTVVCVEGMIFGMIMCHAITNNIGPSNISYIKVVRGDVMFYS